MKKKLCYIKYGNVCEELLNCRCSRSVTGGPYFYVCTTAHILKDLADILFLSINQNKGNASYKSHKAKNISPVNWRGKIGKTMSIIHGCLLILQELIRFNPDHIHCVRDYGILLYYGFARLKKIGFSVSIHTDLEIGHWLQKKMDSYVLKRANTVICHGSYIAAQVKRLSPDHPYILEYNISPRDIVGGKYSQKLEKLGLGEYPAKRILVYVGRMVKEKGIFDLYEAFKKFLPKAQASYILYFAGDGNDVKALFQTVSRDKLEAKVKLLGRITRSEVGELLNKSWAAVTPTRRELSEGRCVSSLESLAMGVPLIAPKYGVFEYLITDMENGLFFTPDSVTDLSRALELMDDFTLRNLLAHGAQKSGQKFFHPDLEFGEAVKLTMGF